jgi:N-acetyl-alpha-D-glucosaminyl L-malate synthase BshA
VRLRVGLLCHDSVGGSVRVAVNLAHALVARGHEVHVFARRTPLEIRPGPRLVLHTLAGSRASGHLVPRLDADWSPEDVAALAELVAAVGRAENLDVLHFHYAVPFAAVAGLVRQQLREQTPAVVGTLHGTDVSVLGRRPAMRRRLADSLARADALTTVSNSHAALAARTFGLRQVPEVIPNFVDTSRFRPASAQDAARERPRIAHVSNFRPVKQPLAVARVFREVRRRVEADLWLIGDGEAMPGLLSRLEGYGLAGRTSCFGLRLDLEAILPDADVLLVTSRTESFCLAALEAAACGVPVVAPRVGGLPETIVDRETGELFEPGDHAGAAAAIVGLLSDRERRHRMGKAAVRQARRLGEDVIVARYEQLYFDLIGVGMPGLPQLAAARA